MAQFLDGDKSLGIYVHVPFCRSKCIYCDFYSLPTAERADPRMDRYLETVIRHIRECSGRAAEYEVDTVYFGGGTPSYFGVDRLREVYSELTRRFNILPGAEVTLEANPDSVNLRDLKRLRSAGFNRISIGVQSDNNQMLRALGRPHTFEQAQRAVYAARDAGFDNVSVDVMYGLPSQTPQQWADTLGSIIDLRPDHISAYGLTIQEGTPLYDYQEELYIPDDDVQASMYLYAVSTLESYGFLQYEISNFCKEDKACLHNLKYWLGGEYMGFGPSAASDFAGTRYTFVSSLAEYVNGLRNGRSITTECEYLPPKKRAGEYVMLRMRTALGISAKEYYHRFSLSFSPLEKLLRIYARRGLAVHQAGRWRLTPKGFLVSNQLIGQLIDAQTTVLPSTAEKFY